MDLTINIEKMQFLTVLRCRGRIVYGPECDQLTGTAISALADAHTVALDLSRARALDSAGVGTLVRIFTSARRSKKQVVLIAPSPKAEEVLRLTRMNTIFEIYPSAQDATAAIARDVRSFAASA